MDTHTYDDFPYRCVIRPDIQPVQLATLATLFNLQPPSVPTCRVLELGCGNGINLMVTAQSLPQAQCIGIDYSAKQIAEGQKMIAEVGLSNITLQHLDILAVNEQMGIFDYIIIHGVYSWVPEPVRKQLFKICQQQLAPQGIAYISYNTYPGWYLSQMQREMFLYFHAQQFQDTVQIHPAETKQLLEITLALNQGKPDAFTHLLQEHWERLSKPDMENYLRHDLLETVNQPLYFYQFIQTARQYELEYVTDVKCRDWWCPRDSWLNSPEIVNQLFKKDFFAKEQYLDFFFNRKLRMSVLCHHGQPVKRVLDPQLLSKCYVAMKPGWSLQTTFPPHSATHQPWIVQKGDKQFVSLTSSWSQLAIEHLLSRYPRNLAVIDLWQQIRTDSHITLEDDQANLPLMLATELLDLYLQEVIDFSVLPTPVFTTTVSDFPTVTPLARWQAAHGHTTIVNLLGQLGQLDEFTCQLLPYLDGHHNRQQLLEFLVTLAISQNLTVTIAEEEIAISQLPTAEVFRILGLYLEEILDIIANHALLLN